MWKVLKFPMALAVTFGEVALFAVIEEEMKWRNHGGMIPMLLLLLVVVTTWVLITGTGANLARRLGFAGEPTSFIDDKRKAATPDLREAAEAPRKSNAKLTVEAVDAFLEKHAQWSTDIVRQGVLIDLNDTNKTKGWFDVEKRTAEELALCLIGNVVHRNLCSGQHHTYRGMLNITGTDLKKVWHAAINEEVRLGYATAAERDEQNRVLNDEIKSMG